MRADNLLYGARNGQHATVGPVLANHHQADRRGPWRLDGQSGGAAIKKVDNGRVAENKPIKAKVFAIGGERRYRRRPYRDGWHQQAVEIDGSRAYPRNEIGARGA